MCNNSQNTINVKTKKYDHYKNCCFCMIGVLALISFVSNIAGVVLLFVHADNSKPASLICATVIICCGMICAVAALAIIAKSYVKRREANTIKNSNDNSADILLKAYKEIINGKEVEK